MIISAFHSRLFFCFIICSAWLTSFIHSVLGSNAQYFSFVINKIPYSCIDMLFISVGLLIFSVSVTTSTIIVSMLLYFSISQ